MTMKTKYIKPETESSQSVWGSDLLVKGSNQVEDYKKGSDIVVGDEDEANSFNNSLWDEG